MHSIWNKLSTRANASASGDAKIRIKYLWKIKKNKKLLRNQICMITIIKCVIQCIYIIEIYKLIIIICIVIDMNTRLHSQWCTHKQLHPITPDLAIDSASQRDYSNSSKAQNSIVECRYCTFHSRFILPLRIRTNVYEWCVRRRLTTRWTRKTISVHDATIRM